MDIRSAVTKAGPDGIIKLGPKRYKVLNDAQSTEILAGLTTDADTQTVGSFIEASRRLGDSWTLEAQVRTFHGTKEDRPLYSFRFDNFAQIDLNYHF